MSQLKNSLYFLPETLTIQRGEDINFVGKMNSGQTTHQFGWKIVQKKQVSKKNLSIPTLVDDFESRLSAPFHSREQTLIGLNFDISNWKFYTATCYD